MALELESLVFVHGGRVPKKFTCEGEDVSPPLSWKGAPAGTKSFAVICDDPDAPMGTWVHWVIYNIPAASTGLPVGMSRADALSDGTRQGYTDFQRTGYGGPCPPPGKPHRYFFKLYALDGKLSVKGKATKEGVLAAMEGHVLGQATLMGLYER